MAVKNPAISTRGESTSCKPKWRWRKAIQQWTRAEYVSPKSIIANIGA